MEMRKEEYVNDKRLGCKYGTKCFQKNPLHHKKYKHPLKLDREQDKNDDTQPNKKIKMETANKGVQEVREHGESIGESSKYKDDKQSVETTELQCKQSDTEKVQTEIEDKKGLNEKQIKEAPENNETDKSMIYLPVAVLDYREFIKSKFLVDMPEDFYQFYDFCESLCPKDPLRALARVGILLVGPFDVLQNKFPGTYTDLKALNHYRYFRDPPEFQTVIEVNQKHGHHIGYFRDVPEEPPVFLASNHANQNGIFKTMGSNIFAAVNLLLEENKNQLFSDKKFINECQPLLTKRAKELNLDLSKKTDKMVERDKKIVARTCNKIGLVVPYDKKTQVGYRSLALNNKDMYALLDKLDRVSPEEKDNVLAELQPLFTYASIAADEGDFGTLIELGWDILAHGTNSLNSTVAKFLGTGYRLLKRDAFARIAEAHMKFRHKGPKYSTID